MADVEKLRKVKQCIDSLAEDCTLLPDSLCQRRRLSTMCGCHGACFWRQRSCRSRCKGQRPRKPEKSRLSG